MAKNKYGVKVKHTKNLYKKKRSKTAHIISTILLIVLIVGLAFLGYFVGKPLMDFFSKDKPAQTSATTAVSTAPSETGIDGETSTDAIETTVTEAVEEETASINAVEAPLNVLQSEQALTAFLKEASSKKYNAAIINLKDEKGHLYYKSSIKELLESDIVVGKLSLSKISSIFSKANVVPIVRISTLSDALAPVVIKDSTYRFSDNSSSWLDDRAEKGGKLWLNPLKSGAKKYIDDITKELTANGFQNIVYSNTVFPFMRTYDISVLPKNVTDKKNRYKALTEIEENGAKHTSALAIEVEAFDMLAYDGYGDSAEILRGKPTCNLNVVFRKADFSEPIPLLDGKEMVLQKDIAELIKQVYEKVKSKAGSAVVTPCIDTEGLSTQWINTITTELTTLGFENIAFGSFR